MSLYDRADTYKRRLYDRADRISEQISTHLKSCLARNKVCMCAHILDPLQVELDTVNAEIVRYARTQE